MTNRLRDIVLLGAPVESGAGQKGCSMGPAALRIAGIGEALQSLGFTVEDLGDVEPVKVTGLQCLPEERAINLDAIAGWTRALKPMAEKIMHKNQLPVFLGGDHSLSMGTVTGVAEYAQSVGRPLFVLWLDAHPDFNTFQTSNSGNIHGTPAAYFCGLSGFDALLGHPLKAVVDPKNVCMMGIRSVDNAERELLKKHGVEVNDISAIDKYGVVRLLQAFLEKVEAANGLLHVSLDVDFLDPQIAPAVGTDVAGGATLREAHLMMEMLHESGLMSALDVVELNPYLDERGRTARLLVDLVASLFGRKIMQTPQRFDPYSAAVSQTPSPLSNQN